MKQLSFWAKRHPFKARTAIILIHTLSIITAIEAGIWLYACEGITLPPWTIFVLLSGAILAKSSYPLRQRSEPREVSHRLHLHRFRAMFALIICGWAYCFWAFNHTAQWAEQPEVVSQTTVPAVYGQMPLLMTEAPRDVQVKTTFKWLKSAKKAHFQKRMQWMRKLATYPGNDLSKTARVLLTVLAVIVFLGLAYLVAGLSCNISCSGNEAAAIVVLILGGGLLIFGLIAAINAIWKGHNNSNAVPDPARPSSAGFKKRR